MLCFHIIRMETLGRRSRPKKSIMIFVCLEILTAVGELCKNLGDHWFLKWVWQTWRMYFSKGNKNATHLSRKNVFLPFQVVLFSFSPPLFFHSVIITVTSLLFFTNEAEVCWGLPVYRDREGSRAWFLSSNQCSFHYLHTHNNLWFLTSIVHPCKVLFCNWSVTWKRDICLLFRQQLASVKGSTTLGHTRTPRCQASPSQTVLRAGLQPEVLPNTSTQSPQHMITCVAFYVPKLLVKLLLFTKPQSPGLDRPQNSFLLWNREQTPVRPTLSWN